MDIVEHSLNGPAENQGFHVNAGAFPGQGAGVPGSGPASQPIRGLQMHSGTSLPPPPQQPPHPQPPPTPTSTPPASDMGKPPQIQQNVNFIQNAQRAQGNPPYFARLSPPANPRMPSRPIMNMGTVSIPISYSGHVLSMPTHHHYLISHANSVPQIQNPQFSQQRQHTQTAGQAFYQQNVHHLTYPNVMPSNNSPYYHSPSHNFYMQTPGNAAQFSPASVSLNRTGFSGTNQGQMNIPPTNVGPQPTINIPHSQPIVNQPGTQQPVTQRSKKKKRENAIPIIDPITGKEVLEDEIGASGVVSSATPPQSNDSSARETPQPGSSNLDDAHASSKQQQVRAEFAAKVAAVATDDVKQTNTPPSFPESLNGPEIIETEINQSVPSSETVKSSKLSSSHVDDYSSISQTSDVVKESTGHNAGPPIHSHGQSMQTPVVSAITGEIQPNWQINHAREQFPALKNTSSSNVSISSSPVKSNGRKQTRVNSETEKNSIQEKLPQQAQPVGQPQPVPQPVPPTPAIINTVVVTPVEHAQTPPAVPIPVSTPAPAPIPVPTSTQKKEKNVPNKNSVANANKEDVSVTNQHSHAPTKERREKQRGKDIPPPVQQPQQQQQQLQQPSLQPEPAPHKPSFSESISIKSINQTLATTVPTPPVVQTIMQIPTPVHTPVTMPEDKTVPVVQQQTNGEALVEPSDGKANQRQVQKKRQKMKDINRKGVEKEGTEMDAFTESNQDEKEKSVPPAPTTVNNPPQSTLSNKTPRVEKVSKDELEEKIVAAKNEENNKLSSLSKTEEDSSPATIIEQSQPQITLKYKYKDDQWSPLNPDGKKKYERDFLLNLQTEPQSMKKPENLPNLEVVLPDHINRRTGSQSIYPTNRGVNDFSPNFFRSGPSGSKGGGAMPIRGERRSMQGKGGSGKSGSSKSGPITVHISFKDDVKLRETENAWRPARMNSSKELTEEQRKTEDLYKKVRAILNKLTPQKFDTLVNQVKALPIDTSARLTGVINLVFDKAIDEPGFAKAYAKMCNLVSNMEVKEEKLNEGKNTSDSYVFRKLLLARCQNEFESNKAAELDSEKRLHEINTCTDAKKKKELQLNYEEEERRIRRKSVGNIRFIGELYKLGMLTPGIMHRCIQHLLSKHEEESLECLCKLLTTIGKDLEAVTKENNLPSLDSYFEKMGVLSKKRENSKVSSRVRFMLQDVIELRHNKWIPRRDDNNPKTIDQIQRDADRESMEMSLALAAPRKQDIRGNDSDRKGKNRGSVDDKDGWKNVPSKNFRPFQYEPNRMQSFKQQELSNVSLGSQSQFNTWGRGANSKNTDKSDNRSSIIANNIYSPLSKERDNDEKHINIRTGKITPSSSMEKERMMAGLKEAMDPDRQSHRVQQSSQPPSRDRTPTPARAIAPVAPSVAVAPPTQVKSTLTPEEIERKAKLIAEEYLCNNNNFEEAKQSIEDLDRNVVNEILFEILKFTINLKTQPRLSIGKLFADLIDIKFLMQNLVLSLYEKLCDQIVAEEWIIDVPLIWKYFAELIAPLIKTDKFSFADLRTICKVVTENKNAFFLPLIQFLCQEYGENAIRTKWVSSRVKLTDFVDNPNDPDVQKAVEFLSRKGDPSASSVSLPMEEVHKKLTNFLQNDKMDFDTIVEWITANVGDKVKEPKFIRALTTAICECSINSNKKLMQQSFTKNVKLITRFIDEHTEELEVQCLCTIHAYVTKLEHPSGLLLKIFTDLWECNVISNDAFIKWRDSDTVEEGKGVSVKSLTSFFTLFNEGEMSDEAS